MKKKIKVAVKGVSSNKLRNFRGKSPARQLYYVLQGIF